MIKKLSSLFLIICFSFLVVFSSQAKDVSVSDRITQIEKALKNPDAVKISSYQDRINEIRKELNTEKTEINLQVKSLQQSLEIVNIAIKDIKTPPPTIQKQIDKLNKDISTLHASDIELNLKLVKLDEIESLLNEIMKAKLLDDVKIKQSFPFSPSFIKKAYPDIASSVYFAATEPYLWLKQEISTRTFKDDQNIVYILVSIILAIIGVVVVKKMFLKHLNYRTDIETPAYPSKLMAAFVEAVSNGIFPATVLGLIYYWLSAYFDKGDELISPVILGGIAVIIYMVLIHSFAKAIFSPNMINWRLTTLSQRQTKAIYRIIILLGIVFCFHLFFLNILIQIESNEASRSLFTVIMNLIETYLSLKLLRHNLWEKESEESDISDDSDDNKLPRKKLSIWWFIRGTMALIILISGIASFFGYIGFGDFIIKRILYSTAAVSLIVVLRSFFHEITLVFINSDYAINQLGISAKRLKVIRFWLMLFLDISLICAAIYVILPLWGVPKTSVLAIGRALVTGFSVGGVTVSFVNIFMAIVVFFIIVKIFSWLQMWLRTKIFPATDMEESLQDSLSAGFGYIGMIMGFIISISVLGINFTNLAIVAGALSVGIGFGLQNIVNNFVSGIILLLERPIKVGDWIIINGNEGIVNRISFRATEIETWNKASILVPNADLISNVLTNWTHNNNYGRVDIPVSVSYKSEVEEIKEILLNIASQNSKVLFVPQPHVMFLGIDEDSLKFELRFFVSNVMESVIIASEIRFNIVKKFKEENIEIPYRHQIMHIKTHGADEEFSFEQQEIKSSRVNKKENNEEVQKDEAK